MEKEKIENRRLYAFSKKPNINYTYASGVFLSFLDAVLE